MSVASSHATLVCIPQAEIPSLSSPARGARGGEWATRPTYASWASVSSMGCGVIVTPEASFIGLISTG